MKYTTEIEIELPRDEMLALLDDPQNMKHWQRGLQSFRQLSGEPGKEGARMELEYLMGKRHLLLVETIIKRDFPREYHLTYDSKGVHNIQKNYFEELEEGRCKWISESEFQFSNFPMKLMGWLMPKAFKKQSLTYLRDFKNFAETGASVAES
ncbi:MAG: SRPBCC family protein [Robiginitalea sp.]|jgi:hypothetical protein